MRVILDLNELLSPDKLNVLGAKTEKVDELYELIRQGSIRSDEEGQKFFYPDNGIAPDNFNRLKKGLQKKMINTVFCSELRPAGYFEKYFDAEKYHLVADILWKKGKVISAALLAKEALKNAIRYQLVPLSKVLSQRLMHHYAIFVPDRKNYNHFKKINEEYTVLNHWETKAEDYYHETVLELRFFKTVKPDFIEKVNQIRQELKKAPINTMHFKFVLFQFDLLFFKMTNNIKGIATTCHQAITFMDSLFFAIPPRSKRSFHFNMIPANILLGDNAAAWVAINEVKQLTQKDSFNWIGVHQYQIILGFHSNDLDAVRNGIDLIKKSKVYKIIIEEIRIYETYLFFLNDAGQINIGKFLNETLHYAHDKKGMNINILILQVLILLKKGKKGEIIERAEALQMYAYRYLNKDETVKRSQIFFRLLFLMVKSAFDPKEIEKRTAKTFLELQQTPRHLSTIDIEVLPYELLWERVKQILG